MVSTNPTIAVDEGTPLLVVSQDQIAEEHGVLTPSNPAQHSNAMTAVAKADPESPVFYLTIMAWITMILFGAFALFQYILPALCYNDYLRWDNTNPGLYRPDNTPANYLMLIHQCGGAFLMTAGPIQLIPSIRRRFIRLHRWTGRVYIAASLIASGCATVFVLLYRTSRLWIHEDIGNFLFGVAAFGSALQSYRYIAITKDIPKHKLWSWRLFGVIFGAALYRVQLVPYGILVILFNGPWRYSQVFMNLTFYTLWAPSWVVIELIQFHNWKPTKALLWVAFGLLTFMTSAISYTVWIPAMLNHPGLQNQLLDEYKPD